LSAIRLYGERDCGDLARKTVNRKVLKKKGLGYAPVPKVLIHNGL
jgi:hypothetical protein